MRSWDSELPITSTPSRRLRGQYTIPRPRLPRDVNTTVQEESKEQEHPAQLRGPDGSFAGFKRLCRGCESYYSHVDETGLCARCVMLEQAALTCLSARTAEDHKFLARAHANGIRRVLLGPPALLTDWTPGDMARHARLCYAHCRAYQLSGGQPDAP